MDLGARSIHKMKDMTKEYLERMSQIAYEGGKIALKVIVNSSPTFKEDESILTKADTEISSLSRRCLEDLLKDQDYGLIDEEDDECEKYLDKNYLESKPFIWVVDPIDGTRSFSNRLPIFGISIGLFKNLKPWMGIVYFPVLKEMFFCDGEQSFFVEKAFTQEAKSILITPIDQIITKQSVFFGNDILFKEFDWDFSFCQTMSLSCAVSDLCWPAIGRGCGALFNAHIWDFAGSWPIFLAAGLNLREYVTGMVLDRLDPELFRKSTKDPWLLKEKYILSSERNFVLLKKNRIPKSIKGDIETP